MKIIAVCGFGVGSSVIAKMKKTNQAMRQLKRLISAVSVELMVIYTLQPTNCLIRFQKIFKKRQLCCLISSIRMQLRKVLILSLKIWANKTKKLIL